MQQKSISVSGELCFVMASDLDEWITHGHGLSSAQFDASNPWLRWFVVVLDRLSLMNYDLQTIAKAPEWHDEQYESHLKFEVEQISFENLGVFVHASLHWDEQWGGRAVQELVCLSFYFVFRDLQDKQR